MPEAPLMTVKEAVDESHPAVQQLIKAGYKKEMSISAIEKYGSPENATEYLVALQAQSSEPTPKNVEVVDTEKDEATQ